MRGKINPLNNHEYFHHSVSYFDYFTYRRIADLALQQRLGLLSQRWTGIYEDSALPLDKWLVAIWMIANDKNGISSYELHRSLGVTQKTAWFMLQRIRLPSYNGLNKDFIHEAIKTWRGKNSQARRKKSRGVSRGKWKSHLAFAGLHAFGLHCALEQRGQNVGLSSPQLAFQSGRRSFFGPAEKTTGKN